MRLITTLSLSAAALACAGLPLYAQNAPAVPFTPAPTVTPATPPPAAAPAEAPARTAAATPAPPAVSSNGIAATVNELLISDYELEQRLAFAVATAGFKPSDEDLKRMRAQTLQNLEEEKIQLLEARRRKLTVSPVEVNRRIDDFVKGNNSTLEQLQAVLAKAGTSIETLRSQQTAAIAWQKTMQAEFGGEVVITPAMIDDAMRRAVEGANKPHYRVSEIFLAVDRPQDDATVKAQIEDIDKQIRSGQPGLFRSLARQYSRNPSAASGGDVGWVYDGQLDPELNTVIASLKEGELSKPVRGKGGWYLLGLSARQEPLGTQVSVVKEPEPMGPPGTLPLSRLLLPLPAGAPKDVIENTMRAAQQVRAAAGSCEALEQLSKEAVLKGSVFMNLGNPKLADLHPDLQKALAQTKPGESAQPVALDAGVEIFMRCDKAPPPPPEVFKLPTRNDLEDRLIQEQIASMARRYMRDLKRKAAIERGDENPVVDAALVR